MPDLEEPKVEFLAAREDMAARFLRTLAERDEGKIILLNLEAGLRLGCILEDVLREVVQECVNRLPPASEYDPAETLVAFLQATKLERFRFLRQPAPDLGVPAALALSTALLFSSEVDLVDQQALERLEEAGVQRDLLVKQDQETVLAELRAGQLLKKDVLGAVGIAVWVTRADHEWEALARACAQSGVADRVRNRLGLPHGVARIYLELRTKHRLGDCCNGSQGRFAAPTAIEAGTHRRFRQEPDRTITDHWNRALDLHMAFVEQGKTADGAPELVLDRLSFDDVEWRRCLGATQTRAPGADDDQSFIARLLNGRSFDDVLDSLVGRLSGYPQISRVDDRG